MSIDKLIKQAEKYALSDKLIENHNNDRLSFIAKFPLNKLKDLTIDEFVQGTDKNSFCYWLEFKKIGFGIGGGNASKFGIYKTKNKQELVYAIGYGKNKTFLDDADANKYYSELMSKIISALEFTKNDEIEKIMQLDIPMWNMVLQKILSIYYPEKFLTIGSPTVIIKCAKEIGLNEIDLSPKNSIQINYECKKEISKHPQFSNWPYEKIGTFIWKIFDGEDEKRKRKDSKHYWLYSPGENAHLWDEFYQNGIMGLGWDEIGDLSKFQNRDEIKKALVDTYGGTGSKKNNVSANDDFLNKINVGDVVIAKKGRGELLGYGIVTSDYIYDKNRKNYQKTRQIDWKLKGNWKVDFNLVLKSLTDITKYSSDHPDYKTYYERLLGLMGVGSTQKDNKKVDVMSFPLNTIFYGPPGTGKTYNTINRALELCGEDLTGISRSDIKARFEQKVDEGRIIFTTFHQSMTYEDFMEGIKPIEPDKEGDPVIYRVEEGIFKKLCIEASFSLAKEEESVATEKVLDFSLAFDNFVQDIEEKLSSEETIEIATKNGGKVVIDSISQQGSIMIKHPGKNNTYPVSKQRLSKLHAAFPDLTDVSNIDQQFRSIIGGSNSTANWAVLNAIRNNNPATKEIPKEIRKYSWDDKVQVVKSLKKEDYKGKKGEPYVLIIDEINRGNVSQIFGELITLIEEDKRLGNPEAIQVQLPYSKDWFGVPPNVYIIGTMNTADRSVEALDTALRRRFSFTEMPPKPKLINTEGKVDNGIVNGIELSALLEIINKRIEKLLDKDHMIGHSYFLSVEGLKGLKSVFQNKIVPLLQEYFFGDFGKIGLVIGSKFFDIKDNQVEEDFFAPFEDYDSSPLVERKVYHLKNIHDMSDEVFIDALNDLQRKNK